MYRFIFLQSTYDNAEIFRFTDSLSCFQRVMNVSKYSCKAIQLANTEPGNHYWDLFSTG